MQRVAVRNPWVYQRQASCKLCLYFHSFLQLNLTTMRKSLKVWVYKWTTYNTCTSIFHEEVWLLHVHQWLGTMQSVYQNRLYWVAIVDNPGTPPLRMGWHHGCVHIVLKMGLHPLARQVCKTGCPISQRRQLWCDALGVDVVNQEVRKGRCIGRVWLKGVFLTKKWGVYIMTISKNLSSFQKIYQSLVGIGAEHFL